MISSYQPALGEEHLKTLYTDRIGDLPEYLGEKDEAKVGSGDRKQPQKSYK